MFLKQYVKETPWAHLDIAGPVWADEENGYNNVGATGFGVRTLVNWVLSDVTDVATPDRFPETKYGVILQL